MKLVAGILLSACMSTATLGQDMMPSTASMRGYVARGLRELAAAGSPLVQVCSGDAHTCAIDSNGGVRCWGNGANGRLGYDNTNGVGDGTGLSVAAAGTVDMGTGITAKAVSCGNSHTCVIDVNDGVRCWGNGDSGRLGYGSTNKVGDGTGLSVAAAGTVDMGTGITAKAVSCGTSHTCVIDVNDGVRCWGLGSYGRLGYGSTSSVSDGTGLSVAAAGTVDMGAGITAKAVSTGTYHTCAIDSNDGVRCWGHGADGRLGYGNTNKVGDGAGLSVAAAGTVDMGTGITAKAVSCGSSHTCVIDVNDGVRCWGNGGFGHLGYGSTSSVSDGTGLSVAAAGTVDMGTGITAKAVSCADSHTCVIDINDGVRCWGFGISGRLGYDSATSVGGVSGLSVAAAGTVNMGTGITAKAISCGGSHTCVFDVNDGVRCWGSGANGRLGYGSTSNVGDSTGSSVAAAGAVAFIAPTPSPSPSPTPTQSATPSASAAHTATPAVSHTATASPSNPAAVAGSAGETAGGSSDAGQLWIAVGVVLGVVLVALSVVLFRRRHAKPADVTMRVHDEITVQGTNPQHA